MAEFEAPRRRTIRASLFVAAVLVAVVAVPLIAHRIDESADRFAVDHLLVWTAVGWLTCGVLAAVLVTRLLQRFLPIVEGPVLAVTYDALPVVLVLAWVVAITAYVSQHWLLGDVAGALCIGHVALLVPRLTRSELPAWVRHAPRLRMLVANVYVDNKTPGRAARQIVATRADVAVIAEATGEFLAVFDRNGGRAYPYRVVDDDSTSDYAVAVVSRRPLGPGSEFCVRGPLRVAMAHIDVGGQDVLVLGLNPMAVVDPDGHETWATQLELLCELLSTLDGPVVVAGDMNTTAFRPEFQHLLELGLVDAVDALGKGLSPSFRLRASGALARVGAVARLDHALVSDGLQPVRMRNLPPRGSDHLPFVVELAVRGGSQGPSSRWRSNETRQNAP